MQGLCESSDDEVDPEEGEEEETMEDDIAVEPPETDEPKQPIKEPEEPKDRAEENTLEEKTNIENKEGEQGQPVVGVCAAVPLPVPEKTQPTDPLPLTQPTPPAIPSKSLVQDGS